MKCMDSLQTKSVILMNCMDLQPIILINYGFTADHPDEIYGFTASHRDEIYGFTAGHYMDKGCSVSDSFEYLQNEILCTAYMLNFST